MGSAATSAEKAECDAPRAARRGRRRGRSGATAAFCGALAVPLVGEEALQTDAQEGAATAFLAIGGLQVILRQQAREELLREVVRVVRRVAGAAHIGAERIPVGAAEGLQCSGGIGRRLLLRREHDGPARGHEERRRDGGGVMGVRQVHWEQ